jgi:hypothetical protein
MKRLYKSSVARLAAILILGALAGCSGGAGTEQNPVTSGPNSGPTYSGPTPATADIQAFRVNFWENIRGADRCGNCHNAGGQSPNFARSDDVNAAYQQASGVVDRDSPSQSRIVTKVAGGHNCWLPDAGACASILTRWITDWVGASGAGARQIELVAPVPKDPGSSKRFPAYADLEPDQQSAFTNLHGLLTTYCANCHTSESATSQSPYFASSDPEEAYLAVLPKINLDTPAESRLVIRLGRESHNCWDNCTNNAATMQAAIQALSDSIDTSAVDPNLVVSKALTLYDGTVAAGGNRYDANVIALYEFKTGQGNTAFDTSGVDPAADLNIFGTRTTDFDWVGGWGIIFKTPAAKAQAATATSRKLHQLITATGEYSVEAWVVPGNVTQEDARIVSYSGSATARNFTLGQTMYNYDALSRSTATGANGTPALSTADAAERLQASLQHVVMTFDPVNGRRIYVNGEFTGDLDSSGGGTLGEWDNSFAFVLGNEVSNNRPWAGVVRLVAIHNRALTGAQVLQNFEAGVGEKFFLLFGIEHIVNVPKSYIMFEATQYDSAGYLFTNPKFISLDPAAMPGSIPLEGMRIGLNGTEPHVGQAYRLLNTSITDANYSAATGQTLSTVGTIVPLERGPASDEFYLCFDRLGSRANVCSAFAAGVPQSTVDTARPPDIGVRTFDGINASMALITGVSPNTPSVKTVYTNVRQSLPAVVDLAAFLSSHQTSIAQVAVAYCSALVDDTTARALYFPALNFNADVDTPVQRDALIDPLVAKAVGNLASQPTAEAKTQLVRLVGDLCTNSRCASGARTPTVAKAVCGAALGSASMLVR